MISGTTTPLAGAVFRVTCVSTDPNRDVIISPTPAAGNLVTTPESGLISIAGPEGSTCEVTEVQAPDDYTIDDPTTRTVVIPHSEPNSHLVVTFENSRLADLVISKTSTGGVGIFTFDVDCTGTAHDRTVALGNPVVITTTTAGTAVTASIAGIPTSTSCTVTEVDHPDFTPVGPSTGAATVAAGGSTVAFTNARDTGTLVISKTSTGGAGTFTFNVNCDGDAFDRTVTITTTTAGTPATATITGIPTGTRCTVTEATSLTGDFSPVGPASGSVVIVRGDNLVLFTNARNTGSLTITKAVVGGTGTFTFDVRCGTVLNQVAVITGSGSQTISGIPTGTLCTVVERPNDLFDRTVSPPNGTVTIDADGETVTVTNTAKATSITLDKKVNGADHATSGGALVVHVGDPLTYTVVITNSGQVPLTITTLADSQVPGFAATCTQGVGSVLAAGASITCTYRGTASLDVNNVARVTAVDGLGRTPSDSDGTFVDVINPAITIVKTAIPTSVSPEGIVTFTYLVTNTGDVTLTNVAVTDDILGAIGTVASLAPGTSTTLTKTMTVSASSPTRNVGTAVGSDVLGKEVTATDTADISVVLGVEFVRPAPPAPPAPLAAVVELPRTGSSLRLLAFAGFALMLSGLALVLTGTRRSQRA